ncbi:DUF1592 domain-containing protein [Parahaliea aestuarii]|uniref:DUF1592 domain-containing protein n=1 Tax=Parahaliea aestuarii TaxID=1852021 RepID=A0A5C9A415_9GAMM|nr:DUF1592 domain-containing protein [Parahaliea aestuarii]TXS94682.1 DUF1592 domain-containing protein [Parahaliea aestuarii]
MFSRTILTLVCLTVGGSLSGPAARAADIAKGAEIYQSACKGCHEVSIGPPLAGVVGRPVASEPGFGSYSDALKERRSLVWTKDELDHFLAAPREWIPGTLMMQTVPDAEERAALIAYLETLGSGSDVEEGTAALSIDQPVIVAVRRLNESQYRNSIRDIFGADIEIKARFEPERREEGLQAVGNSDLSMTSAGFEQYFGLARSIAAQVLDPARDNALAACSQAGSMDEQRECTEAFVGHYGERLFRRPLTSEERAVRVHTALESAARDGDVRQGLQLALTSLLAAPEFLFRIEMAEPDPGNPGALRLDGYSRAARLSFLFWNSAPDEELLAAAATGKLYQADGLQAQVARLADSPHYEEGVRAFFSDLLQLDGFDNLVKDPAIYPKFSQVVADSSREQMLKTLVDLLLVQQRDYRDIFTSNETYINRALAAVYRVPYPADTAWAPYTFTPDSERAGLLSQVGFLSLFAHPGTSSPTRRGIKLHEIFMCEPTPDPPADVDFSKVKDSKAGTVRGRLLDHMENTGCVACHRRSDPPGLALEHFDGLGQLRKYENGQLIDVSATLNGVAFVGAGGLGQLLRTDERIPACLVRNVYAYSAGQLPAPEQAEFIRRSTREFAGDGYRLPGLMQRMAVAPAFFNVLVPEGLAATGANARDAGATGR